MKAVNRILAINVLAVIEALEMGQRQEMDTSMAATDVGVDNSTRGCSFAVYDMDSQAGGQVQMPAMKTDVHVAL